MNCYLLKSSGSTGVVKQIYHDPFSFLMNIAYSEEEAVKKAAEEKLKTLRETDPRKRKQKLMNFLRNRGFTNAVIYQQLRSQD